MVGIELVNVVGGGELEREIDLGELHNGLKDFEEIKTVTHREKPPYGLTIQFNEVKGSITLFTSGKYNIMGCETAETLRSIDDTFRSILTELGILEASNDIHIEINNYVFAVDLDDAIDLPHLNTLLGEESQYEPEQNPFLVYRPETIDCVMTVSSKGKSVANTSTGIRSVHEAIMTLADILGAEFELEDPETSSSH